jgi:succinoglycan biosynthesis transport protein ExoP
MFEMLQGDRSRGISREPLAYQVAQGQQGGGINALIDFALGFLKRQYLLIAVCLVLGAAVAITYLKITPPTYTGQAKLLLEGSKSHFGQRESILVDDAPLDVREVENQLQLLKSKSVLGAVVDRLKLAEDPDFNPATQPLARLIGLARRLVGLGVETPPAPEADDLVTALEGRMTTARVGFSNVIEINYNSTNPLRAAEVANAIAEAYIADKLSVKVNASRTATTWLQGRLRDLGEQALAAESAVSAYRSNNNVVALDGKLLDEQQVTELSTRVVAARAQTLDALARLNTFEGVLHAKDFEAIARNPNLDAAVSDAMSNPIINSLRQQYLEYARRDEEFTTRFGNDHQAVVNLRARMREVRTSILDELRRLAEASRNDYQAVKQRQEGLEKQLAEAVSRSRTTKGAEGALRELDTKAKGYRSLYESLLQRYMGAVQQESFPLAEARLISPASPPQSKSKPKGILILALGLLGGLAFGAGIGFLREMMESVFRTTEQVERQLQMPCLSVVPRLDEVAPQLLPRELLQASTAIGQRAIARGSGVYWGASEMPQSRFAESIRSIKLAVDLNLPGASSKVIGITSALPREGKSTIAAALAMLSAHTGARVIVVDCDLRNPSLSRTLTPDALAGMIEVIAGERTLEDVIWKDPKTGLSVLPSVSKRPLIHTSEILSAAPTRLLFEKLRASYDYVVVDLPPLVPIVDTRAGGHLVDGLILVVEWASTRTDVVQQALHAAPNLQAVLIGAVVNKTDMKALKRYTRYHGDEHYDRYGITS